MHDPASWFRKTWFTRRRVRELKNAHNSVTVQNRTHVYMNFFHHKDLGNHLLQLCPKVVKHPVFMGAVFKCQCLCGITAAVPDFYYCLCSYYWHYANQYYFTLLFLIHVRVATKFPYIYWSHSLSSKTLFCDWISKQPDSINCCLAQTTNTSVHRDRKLQYNYSRENNLISFVE